jgi:hypothetical protein
VFFQAGQGSVSPGLYGGRGPIYGQGGPETNGTHGYYYDVTWLSDASYHGVAIVRGRRLDGNQEIVFAGQLAAGRLVTTDNVGPIDNYRTMNFYSELVIPAGNPNDKVWRRWAVTQGVPGPGCYGFQIDGPSFQELVVTYVPPGG